MDYDYKAKVMPITERGDMELLEDVGKMKGQGKGCAILM